eukprot:1782584-Prymnesium_polylepis.1
MAGVGLLAADKGGTSDPYVRLTLKKMERRSRVQLKTLDPVWEEDFVWKGTKAELLGATMSVEVFDSDGTPV